MMALATIEVARDEFGLKAGRDLGVAGFDDIEGASWSSFDLTTYTQPIEAMIEKVSEIILNPGQFHDGPQIVVEGELKIRSSTKRK
jgi:DNA-binding LacI/PurR family transcriptional regulator